jgi:adenylate kinase
MSYIICNSGFEQTCVDEYIAAHHLHPLRVFVHGGPCVGKSTLCESLAKEHYIPHLKLETMVEAALGGKDDFAVELEKALVPNPDKKNKKKDRRLPLPQLIQVVQKQLQQPLCRNKGYVLDGFPRTLEEARALFVCEPPKVEGDDAAAPAATGPVFQVSLVIIIFLVFVN